MFLAASWVGWMESLSLNTERQQWAFFYLFLEVDEAVALIDEEKLQGTTTKVVASEMYLSQLFQLPLEVLCVTGLSAWSVVKEMHVGGSDLQLTFHYFHHCHKLTFLLQHQLLFATQLFRHWPDVTVTDITTVTITYTTLPRIQSTLA